MNGTILADLTKGRALGFVIVALGIHTVVQAQWLLPRQFRRTRDRIVQRGDSTERFDAMLRSHHHRLMTPFLAFTGVLSIAVGIFMVVSSE